MIRKTVKTKRIKNHYYNFEFNGTIIPASFSWMAWNEQRKGIIEMGDKINSRKKGHKKAKDIDIGFNNMGLQ